MMTLAADSIVTGPAGDPPAFFCAAIIRAGQVAVADLQAIDSHLPDAVRDRTLHVLSFVLKLPAAWPQTRDLLLMLAPWLEIQGFRSDWAAVLEAGAAQARQQDDPGMVARLHLQLGRLHLLQGDHVSAALHLQRAAALAEAMDDAATLAGALHRLAWSAVQRSLLPEAEQLAQRALRLLAVDDPHADQCYTVLGRVALYRRDWEAAIAHFRSSLVGRMQQGGPMHIGPGLRDLGIAYMMSGRYAEAIATMQEAIEMFGQIGNSYEQSVVRVNLGITHWYQGEHYAALACFDASEVVFRKLGVVGSLGRLYSNRGLAYRDLGRFDEAETACVQAIEFLRMAGAVIEIANTLETLSSISLRLGHREEAIIFLHDALRHLEQLPERPAHVHQLIVDRLREIEG